MTLLTEVLTDSAHAKVNLFLHVTGRRADGYHLLDSLAVFAGAGDRLTLGAPVPAPALRIEGPFGAGLATEQEAAGADNLVLRAAEALKRYAAITEDRALTLEKNLPVASGIGGGSADAACALRLLAAAWNVPRGALVGIAAQLGADVPVCLEQKAARMRGIGEVLLPAPPLPEGGILLVNPGVAVSTPAVFRALAASGGATPRRPPEFPAAWRDMKHLVAMLEETGNDLEAPAVTLTPVIGDVIAAIASLPDCLLARMSGSGATCFGLFDSPRAAREAARSLRETAFGASWWTWAGPFHHAEGGTTGAGRE